MQKCLKIRGTLLGASLALAAFVSAPALSGAQQIVSTGQSFVTGRLIPGTKQEDGSRLAGLRLSMEPGWKTYWRSPGEAGIPPRFDWSASANVDSVEVLWPRPQVFTSFGLRTIGYSNQGCIAAPRDTERSIAPDASSADDGFGCLQRDVHIRAFRSRRDHRAGHAPDRGPARSPGRRRRSRARQRRPVCGTRPVGSPAPAGIASSTCGSSLAKCSTPLSP